MWNPRQRDLSAEIVQSVRHIADKDQHPLADQMASLAAAAAKLAIAEEEPASPSKAADPLGGAADPLGAGSSDPLGAGSSADPLGAGSDPLSASGGGFSSTGSVLAGSKHYGGGGDGPGRYSRFASWKDRRALILKQYASSGQFKVNSDLLNADGVSAASLGANIDESGPKPPEKGGKDGKPIEASQQVSRRLEQLEAAADAADGKTVRLTHSELVSRVEALSTDLKRAWDLKEATSPAEAAAEPAEPGKEGAPRKDEAAMAAAGRSLSAAAASLFELAVGVATLSSEGGATPAVRLAAKMYGLASSGTHAESARLKAAAEHLARLAAEQGGGYADLLSRVQKLRAK